MKESVIQQLPICNCAGRTNTVSFQIPCGRLERGESIQNVSCQTIFDQGPECIQQECLVENVPVPTCPGRTCLVPVPVVIVSVHARAQISTSVTISLPGGGTRTVECPGNTRSINPEDNIACIKCERDPNCMASIEQVGCTASANPGGQITVTVTYEVNCI